MENLINQIQEDFKRQANSIEYKCNRVQQIYDNTPSTIVRPGFYSVTETDDGGMYTTPIFTIEITKPIAQNELALILIKEKGYMSPWNDLTLEVYAPSASIRI